MQKDRRAYEKYELKNGITVFHLPMDVQIGQAIINIPLGTQNNIEGTPLGGAHFLEHCVLNRSEMFPELDSFKEFVGKEGGYSNGTTSIDKTFYEIEMPAVSFMHAFKGMLSQVYNPIILQEDIDGEKRIIKNERIRRAPFFPGTTEASQYFYTKIILDMPSSLEKIFGDDETLEKMDVELIKNLHKNYFTNKTTVFLGGTIPLDECLKLLEIISTVDIDPPSDYNKLDLVNDKYHEQEFKEIHRFEYSFFYLIKHKRTYEELRAMQILLGTLTNRYTGKIYKWLRNDIGVYEIPTTNIFSRDASVVGFDIPLSSTEKLETVRGELDKRITEALGDDAQIKDYVESIRRGDVFSFQTLDGRFDSIFYMYNNYGFPITDKIANETLGIIEQPGYLLNFYNKLKNESEFGEFLSKPIGDK
ncbi:hypothetical protein A3J61_00930 [Candidatus Nomurabacteria bacterium RIFCSPHIGHO2_02_FULL_38_15]|uniref:Peptidase M16 N-terminal domain-containing protein n=1 Tax=Candidatus Nomurabacteria bacterium RIFCSPHIGHO2_02_FULL_38_15 TaxID=1801752 RepID=A0A1F6VR46_9BACT|nr:MAG: hypothetical protein A3J61_00930 [Candidatus Nomurabacteria bacterium RIFCSPHIGHO2_02_FULL_38_15]